MLGLSRKLSTDLIFLNRYVSSCESQCLSKMAWSSSSLADHFIAQHFDEAALELGRDCSIIDCLFFVGALLLSRENLTKLRGSPSSCFLYRRTIKSHSACHETWHTDEARQGGGACKVSGQAEWYLGSNSSENKPPPGPGWQTDKPGIRIKIDHLKHLWSKKKPRIRIKIDHLYHLWSKKQRPDTVYFSFNWAWGPSKLQNCPSCELVTVWTAGGLLVVSGGPRCVAQFHIHVIRVRVGIGCSCSFRMRC